MSFSSFVRDKVHTFYGAGFYDGMTLLSDHQTGSYWDHLTGECVAGELQGERLELLSNMLHTTAEHLAQRQPNARLAITALDAGRAGLDDLAETIRTAPQPPWLPQLQESVTVEDNRLPRFEMGLGVWTDGCARFYPFTALHARDNRIFDQIDGKGILVYVDPDTLVPTALYTEASDGNWRGETLVLENGQRLREGVLYEENTPQPMTLPMQLFQRWYGFSITFPGCEIYANNRIAPTP
jgi:hypothetical protein